ncbi:FeoA family protein [Alkalibacter saccharofermentans]|uniref:Ferrous iron transport protein A n=1 Tax=Alkalibacter saccharofermentans DSM 14828 TaxID=1120975 RepID=A0A1M4U8T7_9FIRM|nr:ferrous iron transport protein A [Alkalibacter saccharofermentans]SHE53192.1 ferrous iron transport protein A [Alkalibacter saccharofermentans DSM 14828]
MTIIDLKPGQSGEILELELDRKMKNKLMEMGMTPGTSVKFVRTAPLGDPINIKVRGFNLGIRRAVAQNIILK